MRLTLALALAAGFLVAGGLVAAYGAGPILEAVAAVGWGLVPVSLVRTLECAGAGLCWWLLIGRRSARLLGACLLLRWVRESVNALLPVAQVGGDVVGARLLTFWGIAGSLSAATVLADLLLQTATQALFTAAGLAILATRGGGGAFVQVAVPGLAALVPALAAFYAVQRYGLPRLAGAAVRRFGADPRWAALAGGLQAMTDRLGEVYAHRGRLVLVLALHLSIWFLGVFEVWFALRFMGHPVDYPTAIVIESLGQAVRGAAFVVPGGIGVQEAGFVALCALFGIPAPAAIALSLAKRFPEIVLGLPGLLVWQAIEGRRLMRARPAAERPGAEETAPS